MGSLGSLEDKTLTQISYNLATAMNIHCDNSALVQVQNFLLNNALDTTTTELPIVGTYQTTANVQQQEVAADDVNIKNCFLSAERGIQTISPASVLLLSDLRKDRPVWFRHAQLPFLNLKFHNEK